MNATDIPADPEFVTINNPGTGTGSGGLTAIWHLTIVTGKEAETLLEMQNQAIIRLLTWAADHEKPASQNIAEDLEMVVNVSRETLELAA